MECVVNDKYKYIMFYGAKAACTSLRNLYLAIHSGEMSKQQLDSLDSYHNLRQVCPFEPQNDYSDYYKFYISRNPYERVVSAFLDQYTFARYKSVQSMLDRHPHQNHEPQTFVEFLRYLRDVPDHSRDSHFQTQSHFAYKNILTRKPRLRRTRGDQLILNYHADVRGFNNHLEEVYRVIFMQYPQMLKKALAEIPKIPRMNNLIYGEEDWPNADAMKIDKLRRLAFVPKPQDFYSNAETRQLVQEIYARDFAMFAYNKNSLPHKKASSELTLMPADFDWQAYQALNPDLASQGVNNERRLTHHYLMHGRNESKKRFYKLEAPDNFEWQTYLKLNGDLQDAGIDNERDALIHYLAYGYHEKRVYRIE